MQQPPTKRRFCYLAAYTKKRNQPRLHITNRLSLGDEAGLHWIVRSNLKERKTTSKIKPELL